MEAVAKEVKKMSVASGGDGDVLQETDAQREARHAQVKQTVAEMNTEDPR